MLNVLIGFISGICTGLGLGGGATLILLLDLFLNFDQHIAQATNIVCFIPSAIISLFINIKNKNIIFNLSIPIIIFGILGSIIGATISSKLDVQYLKKLFGVFLILIALNEFYSLIKEYIKNRKSHNNIN